MGEVNTFVHTFVQYVNGFSAAELAGADGVAWAAPAAPQTWERLVVAISFMAVSLS
jgi:hypothetical protein